MKYPNLFFAIALAFAICSCNQKSSSVPSAENVENEIAKCDSTIDNQDYSDLIKTVYDEFVFVGDTEKDEYTHPEKYFTAKALQKLKDNYEFDCDNGDCYAFYELRTQEQDSKPGTDGESHIINIENMGDGWHVVKYTDMGWSGITRIKIADGKIDDYDRCVEDL